ncbi:MAG: hypothetical protein U9P70_04360 [Patescibacteria group bacterium]|nr:hypothetical protein [Patescibacteria group bacterium]
MSNKIILSEKFKSSSLITRQAARELFDVIFESDTNKIILDFNKIEFASRSFFDELNSKMNKIKLLGKNIEIVNLNENLDKLYKIVVDVSKSKSSISYSSVSKASVITI